MHLMTDSAQIMREKESKEAMRKQRDKARRECEQLRTQLALMTRRYLDLKREVRG